MSVTVCIYSDKYVLYLQFQWDVSASAKLAIEDITIPAVTTSNIPSRVSALTEWLRIAAR